MQKKILADFQICISVPLKHTGGDKLKTGRQQVKNLNLAACLIKEKHS